MADALEQVLQLVADGRLTAEQAAPLIDALGTPDRAESGDALDGWEESNSETSERPIGARGSATSLRIEIREGGRRVVNLRIPVPLGRFALDRIPGISGTNADLVREALVAGRVGTLLALDDEDGDGVRIALE